jgi:hypothetical protein
MLIATISVYFGEIAIRRNGLSVKWTFGEMDLDFGEMDNSAKWIRRNIPSMKCPFGEMSIRRSKWLRRNVP